MNLKDIERIAAHGLEHGIDAFLDALWAHNPPQDVEAKIHSYIEASPLSKFLGLGVIIVEGEIDSIIEHNDSPTALAKIKAYVHGRLLVK